MKTAACMPVSGDAWMQTCVLWGCMRATSVTMGAVSVTMVCTIVSVCAGVLSLLPIPMNMHLSSYLLTIQPLCPPPGHEARGKGFPLLLRHIPRSSTSDKDRTWDWRAAAPTLVVFKFVLAITYTMLQLDLEHGLPRTQHPYLPQHLPPTSLPTTPLYLIAISIFAINILTRARLLRLSSR